MSVMTPYRPSKWLTWAMSTDRYRQLSPAARRVLVGLLVHVRSDGVARPGKKRIMAACAMTERTVRAGLVELAEVGLIRPESGPGQTGAWVLLPIPKRPWEGTGESHTRNPRVAGCSSNPQPYSMGGNEHTRNPSDTDPQPNRQSHTSLALRSIEEQKKQQSVSPSRASSSPREASGETAKTADGLTDDGKGPDGPAVKTAQKQQQPIVGWLDAMATPRVGEDSREGPQGSRCEAIDPQGVVSEGLMEKRLSEDEGASDGVGDWARVTRAVEAAGVLPVRAATAGERLLRESGGDVDLALSALEVLVTRAETRGDHPPAMLVWLLDHDIPSTIERLRSSAPAPTPPKPGEVPVDEMSEIRARRRRRIEAARRLLLDDPARWSSVWDRVAGEIWGYPARPMRDVIDQPETDERALEVIGAALEGTG